MIKVFPDTKKETSIKMLGKLLIKKLVLWTSPVTETRTTLRSFRLDNLELGSTDHSDSDSTESLDIKPDLNRARKKMKSNLICTKVLHDKANPNSNSNLLCKILEMLLLQRHSLDPLTTRKMMMMTCLVKWFHRNLRNFLYLKRCT